MRDLAPSYSAEVDSLDSTEWYEILGRSEFASIYQTPAYGAARYGADHVSRMVVRRNGTIVAAAQCGILRAPILGGGIAHLRWGPLWRWKNGSSDAEDFRQAIRALRNEYASRRGLFLRVYPRMFSNEREDCERALLEEGFSPWGFRSRERTLVINLERSLAELREGMEKKWRRHLRRAEKRGMDLVEGTEDRLFEEFIGVYRGMLELKSLRPSNDVHRFRTAQEILPEQFKMRIFLCREGGEACAGIIASAIGSVGLTMFRATNERGRNCEAAYLVHWRALEWLKESGCTRYDMDGINPVTNPGTYQYKAGLCGRNGVDASFLGQFDACEKEITSAFVKTGEQLLRSYRSAKHSQLVGRFGRALKRVGAPSWRPSAVPKKNVPGVGS